MPRRLGYPKATAVRRWPRWANRDMPAGSTPSCVLPDRKRDNRDGHRQPARISCPRTMASAPMVASTALLVGGRRDGTFRVLVDGHSIDLQARSTAGFAPVLHFAPWPNSRPSLDAGGMEDAGRHVGLTSWPNMRVPTVLTAVVSTQSGGSARSCGKRICHLCRPRRHSGFLRDVSGGSARPHSAVPAVRLFSNSIPSCGRLGQIEDTRPGSARPPRRSPARPVVQQPHPRPSIRPPGSVSDRHTTSAPPAANAAVGAPPSLRL